MPEENTIFVQLTKHQLWLLIGALTHYQAVGGIGEAMRSEADKLLHHLLENMRRL